MKDNNIKNIVVINDFDYVQGGASKVAISTANLLAEKENLNVYFFSGISDNSSILSDKVKKICTNQHECFKDNNRIRGMINGIYNNKAKKKLKKLLLSLNKNETVVHIHGWTKCLSSSIFDIIFKMKFKVVLTLHEYFTICPNGGCFNYRINEKCLLKGGSCKCFFKNCDSRNYIIKWYRNIRFFVQNRIVKVTKKIENIIYISKFSWNIMKNSFEKNINAKLIYNPIQYEEKSEKIDLQKNDYFLYVGRLSKEKGVDIFCEAVIKAKVKAIIVGDGEQKEILQNKYSTINFVGWKDSDDVKKYMKGAKALVFPSRWYETMGLTILEAQALGIPSIVKENCAGTEFIENGINGYIFQNENDLSEIFMNFNLSSNNVKINNMFNENNYINSLIEIYTTKR